MYILCKYVNCIYHYRGPHGRLAVTLCSYVFAKCCVPLKIKSLLTYLLTYLLINHIILIFKLTVPIGDIFFYFLKLKPNDHSLLHWHNLYISSCSSFKSASDLMFFYNLQSSANNLQTFPTIPGR